MSELLEELADESKDLRASIMEAYRCIVIAETWDKLEDFQSSLVEARSELEAALKDIKDLIRRAK